jgi:hypothetical protein
MFVLPLKYKGVVPFRTLSIGFSSFKVWLVI